MLVVTLCTSQYGVHVQSHAKSLNQEPGTSVSGPSTGEQPSLTDSTWFWFKLLAPHYTCIHTYPKAHRHTYIYMRTFIPAYVYSYTHTFTYIHTYMHTLPTWIVPRSGCRFCLAGAAISNQQSASGRAGGSKVTKSRGVGISANERKTCTGAQDAPVSECSSAEPSGGWFAHFNIVCSWTASRYFWSGV
jgi:hypothetical protein